MVTTPALSRVFTSTPDSCETGAVAMAVVPMANRMVPSSCFNLISLSPHAVVGSPQACTAFPSSSLPHQVQTTILPQVRPHCTCKFRLLSTKSWTVGVTTSAPDLPSLQPHARFHDL